MRHVIKFRWSIKQCGDREVEILTGPNGVPILHERFTEPLTDEEIARAEHVVIRELAVLDE